MARDFFAFQKGVSKVCCFAVFAAVVSGCFRVIAEFPKRVLRRSAVWPRSMMSTERNGEVPSPLVASEETEGLSAERALATTPFQHCTRVFFGGGKLLGIRVTYDQCYGREGGHDKGGMLRGACQGGHVKGGMSRGAC